MSFIDLHTNVSLGHTKITGLGGEKLWLCPTLGGDKLDISGNGNHGTYNGGMGTVADTSNGGTRAYSFDGSNDYISTGSTSVHQNTLFSYSFWINASASASGTEGTLGSYETIGGHRGPLACSTASNSKMLWLYQSNGSSYNASQQLYSLSDVYDSTWRHIVCEFDGNSNIAKIYVDGTLDNSASSSVPNSVNISTPLKIGNGGNGYTHGYLDDIRIFDRALTTSEITHLASKRGVLGTPRNPVIKKRRIFYAPAAPVTTTAKAVVLKKPKPSYATGYAKNASESANPNLWKGLVGAWMPSFGVTGKTLKDVSGNGNDGTLTNMDAASDWVGTSKGLALDFDGVNDYVYLSGDCLKNSLSWSLCFWIYASSNDFNTGLRARAIYDSTNDWNTAGGGLWVTLDTRGGTLRAVNGISVQARYGTSDLRANASHLFSTQKQWHYVSVVASTAQFKIFFDGEDATTYTSSISGTYTADGSQGTYISGAHYSGTFAGIKTGSIFAYNRALSPTEIKQLYRNPAAPFLRKQQTVGISTAQAFNPYWGNQATQLAGTLQ